MHIYQCDACNELFYGWSDNTRCDCGGNLKPKEATMQEPFQLPTYLDMIRQSPRQAVKEILSCAFILALMAGALYFKEILFWIEGVLK